MKYITAIINLGIDNDVYEDSNDIKLINIIALSGAVFCFIFSILMTIQWWVDVLILNIFTTLFCIGILFINFKKHYLAAVIGICLILPIIIFSYIWLFGNIGSENYLFMGALMSLYFFRKYKKLGLLIYILCGALFIGSKILLWKVHEELVISPDKSISFFFNVVFSYVLIYFMIDYFKTGQEKEREKIGNISESRGRLVSMLSHDMKNPIKNLEHILSGSILTNLSAEEHKKVMSLLSEQLKYTGLTMENSILWVKQQMDGLKVNKTKFNLTELIQTNILLIKDSIDRKSIQIKLDLEKDFSVYGDRDVYNIVVRNLLSNAIKFSYPETGIIEIFQTLSEGKHWVSVKDNGQGIELDKLNMIFSQNESTFGTMQESGYGLGLKLVKSFLNNINEDIKVESTVDKGSVFSFTITKNTVN